MSSLESPTDRPFCVITVEKPWFGTRKKDDEPRAFWVRDQEPLALALRGFLRPELLSAREAPEAQETLSLPEAEFLMRAPREPLESALTVEAFGEDARAANWRKTGAVSVQRRFLNDLTLSRDEGPGALILRCMCPNSRDEAPLARLISALGQSMDRLIELPCSPTEGSFVGASFDLWLSAIDSFHERLALQELANFAPAPAAPERRKGPKGL